MNRDLLLELKQILEDDFNLKLTLQEVMEVGMNLLAYVETLIIIESINKGGKQNDNHR